MNRVAILFALRRESRPFLRHIKDCRHVPAAPCPAWIGEVAHSRPLVLETGIGQARAARALEWLGARPVIDGVPFEPRTVIVAGFAGSLSERLKVGDVVSASEVIDVANNVWPLVDIGLSLPRARLLTVDQLVDTPQRRSALALAHGAKLVDMESALAARFCAAAGLPLLCLRAISDDAASGLPPQLVHVMNGSRVSPARLAWALLRRPWLVVPLWRLARATRRAAAALAQTLRKFLETDG